MSKVLDIELIKTYANMHIIYYLLHSHLNILTNSEAKAYKLIRDRIGVFEKQMLDLKKGKVKKISHKTDLFIVATKASELSRKSLYLNGDGQMFKSVKYSDIVKIVYMFNKASLNKVLSSKDIFKDDEEIYSATSATRFIVALTRYLEIFIESVYSNYTGIMGDDKNIYENDVAYFYRPFYIDKISYLPLHTKKFSKMPLHQHFELSFPTEQATLNLKVHNLILLGILDFSINVLNLRSTNYVIKKVDSTEEDVESVISSSSETKLKKDIAQIVKILEEIKRTFNLNTQEIEYVRRYSEEVLTLFFKSNILKIGISPELFFIQLHSHIKLETKFPDISSIKFEKYFTYDFDAACEVFDLTTDDYDWIGTENCINSLLQNITSGAFLLFNRNQKRFST